MPFFDTLFFLLVFGSILFLAYVATKYIGARTGKTMKSRNISIVETVSLGMDKQLHLVKVAGQFVLISSSGKNIQFLTAVNMEQQAEEDEVIQDNVFDFKKLFERHLSGFTGKSEVEVNSRNKDSDGFSSDSNIFRNNLNKLKDLTAGVNGYASYNPKEATKDELDGVDYTNDK